VHEPEDIRAANEAAAALQRKHMDFAGIALLAIGVATLQYVLEDGSRDDWFDSRAITYCAIVAVFSLVAFVLRELSAPMPAVDLSLFKDTVFTSGTLIGAVMFAMLLSITFLLPVFMQELLGFTAMQSGVALMPRSLVMLVAMPVVGRIYNKVSPRGTVAFGVILFAITAYMMSHYTLETSSSQVVKALLLQGVAFSCLWIPLTTVALASVPRQKLADATGINSLIRQIGGSLGLALFASLIPHYTKTAATGLAAHVTFGSPEVQNRLAMIQQGLIARGYDAATASTAAGRILGGMVMRQATMLTFEKLFLGAGILFLLVLPLLFFLKSPDHGDTVKPEVHVEM
jgi:DHA2 family multidrug resistance protein